MNPPQVYMCSPSWTLLPPPSPFHPSGSSQCTSPKHLVSCIEPGLATHFIHDILHVSMPVLKMIEIGAAAASAKSLQSCPTLCDPRDGSPPGSAVLGFSRHEHWSGKPFPTPMHESENWKWSRSVMSYSSQPHGMQPTRLLRPWDFPGKSTGVGCHCVYGINCQSMRLN